MWCVVSLPPGTDYDTVPPHHEIEAPEDYDWEESGEYGDFFEGDMDLNEDQLAVIFGDRNAISNETYRWPNAIVPFRFSELHSDEQNAYILEAFRQIENVSCVKFRPWTNETDYVQIEAKDTGCHAAVGRQGGEQNVNLKNDGCFKQGVIIHEFLHALGFYDMQSASNRDTYVKINYKNIENKTSNFKRHESTDFGIPYDFGSIMHYKETAFSKDKTKLNTIEAKAGYEKESLAMGQRKRMSPSDILKLNLMYPCPKKNKATIGEIDFNAVVLLLIIVLNSC